MAELSRCQCRGNFKVFPPHVRRCGRHVKMNSTTNIHEMDLAFPLLYFVKDLPISESSRPPTARDVIYACIASYISASCIQFIAHYYGFVHILMRRFPATSDGSDACRELRNLGILAVALFPCTNAWYRIDQRRCLMLELLRSRLPRHLLSPRYGSPGSQNTYMLCQCGTPLTTSGRLAHTS